MAKKLTDYLSNFEKVMIFSPHLDDAVLSMGSLISYLLSHKVNVEVISFFTEGSQANSNSIKIILNRANFTDARKYFQARRLEDKLALELLGPKIKFQHLGFTDAAWREDKKSALYPDTQLGEINPKDNSLIKTITKKVQDIIKNSKDTLFFAPVARGKHVDHQIVRNISSQVSSQIIFYEDFPYSTLYENENKFIKSNKLKAVRWHGDLKAKKKAIFKYRTQKASLFSHKTMHLPFEKYFVSKG